MALQAIIVRLGTWSDAVTKRFLRRNTAVLPDFELSPKGMRQIRSAQYRSIRSGAVSMSSASLINALAICAVDVSVHGLRTATVIWAALMILLALFHLYRILTVPADGSQCGLPQASGVLILQIIIGGLLWCFPPVFLLAQATPLEAGFISAVMAGTIAGGALVLYPMPLAAILFASIGVCGFVGALLIYQSPLGLYYLIATASFLMVIGQAITRYSLIFLGDLLRKAEADGQRDMIALLMGDYQEASLAWLIRCDAGLRIRELSPGLLTALGASRSDATDMPLHLLLDNVKPFPVSLRDDESFRSLAGSPQSLPLQLDMMIQITLPDDTTRILTIFVRKTFGEGRLLTGFDGFARDVTEEYRTRERARYLVNHDPMTGLLNPTGFQAEVQVRLKLFNGRGGDMNALFLFIDADNLKSVNDTYGHGAGDELIRVISRRLSAAVGMRGVVTRKSGDEFLAVLLDIDPAEAEATVESIRRAICREFQNDGVTMDLFCSFGVAQAPAGAADLWTMQQEADRALYYAKRAGRGKLVHYTAALGAALQYERQLAASLPGAIRQATLRVEFQPILRLSDHSIYACEALVRWDHPDLGRIPPERLVQAARATHLSRELAELVLRSALQAAHQWPPSVSVTVNLPAQELNEHDCYDRIQKALSDAGVPPQQLCVEITENELLENSEHVRSNLMRLRSAGVRIFIDDFGAGYSSLNYLPQYPTDAIKVDRSLVINSARSEAGPLILGAVAAMARALGVPAVAEGVETDAELTIARNAGFELVQGFLFHRPMRQQDLLALFETDAAPAQIADAVNC